MSSLSAAVDFAAFIDWGTSSLRVYSPTSTSGSPPLLLFSDPAGGVLGVAAGDFSSALERALEAAGIGDRGPVLVSGMAGSSRGWAETPYVSAPADAATIAGGARTLLSDTGRVVVLLPGVRTAVNANGLPDIMRGEETQVLGVPAADADILVLPGTHSKWVLMDETGIKAATTFMTGELFHTLRKHSILSSSIAAPSAPAPPTAETLPSSAFFEGLRLAAPLAGLFSVRVRDVLACSEVDRALVQAENDDFMSGALLSLEIREARAWWAASGGQAERCRPRVIVVGASPLLESRYVAALREGDWCDARPAAGSATARGLSVVAAYARPHLPEALKTAVRLSLPCRDTEAPSVAPGLVHSSRLARWRVALTAAPVVAILRGITPDQVVAIGMALVSSGVKVIEVPLNSPRPLESVRVLASTLRGLFPDVLVGAGTVLTIDEVNEVAAAGGDLVFSPNSDAAVVREARRLGLIAIPGVATATEAFAALAAGATALKLFPCTAISPETVRSLRAVLPADSCLIAVGGVSTTNAAQYSSAGINAFGLGTALYSPGATPESVAAAARSFLTAIGHD